LALAAPFILLRAAVAPRAVAFNPSLNLSAWWQSAPALLSEDVMFALVGGIVLALLGLGRRSKRRGRWLCSAVQLLLLAAATMVATLQYRVFYEVGLLPSFNMLRQFLQADRRYLPTLGALATWPSLGLLLAAALLPCLLFRLAERWRRAALIGLIPALVVMLIGWFWPMPPAVAAIAGHPFRRLLPADFETPTPQDPEVAATAPSFRSISGLGKRDDCQERVSRVPSANLLLVILESTSDQYLYSDGQWRYPNLRRMAAGAVCFPHYYSPAGRSNPAIHTMFTSSYLVPSDAWWPIEEQEPPMPLPRYLTQHGYQTSLFISGSFTYFFDGPLFRGMGWDACQDGDELAALYHVPWEEREPQGGCINDALLMDHAMRWIDRRLQEAKPFLTVLYTGVPHTPYVFCSEGPHAIYTQGRLTAQEHYENQLGYVDAQLGRLYDHLLETSFFHKGFLVVTGDHGEAFGQHPGNYIHGTDIFEENVRVPFLIVNPEHVQPGLCETPGSHLALAPTLLDLAGLPPAESMQGTSLLAGEGPDMVFLITTLDWVSFGLVDRPYKYIYRASAKRSELYRLDHDPEERVNLADAEPVLTAAYRSWVKSFLYHTLTPEVLRHPSPATREYYEGRRLLLRARPSAAVVHFRRALALRPEYRQAREALASSYFEIGLDRMRYSRWDQAALAFQEALLWAPDRSEVRAACADALVRTGQYRRAMQVLKEGGDAASSSPGIILRVAWLLATAPDQTIRDPAEALRLLERLPAPTGPPSALDLDVRAAVEAANGRHAQAASLAEQALTLVQPRGKVFGIDHAADLQARLTAYRAAKEPPFRPFPETTTGSGD
jgi:arylsulfatase A-like enzyme